MNLEGALIFIVIGILISIVFTLFFIAKKDGKPDLDLTNKSEEALEDVVIEEPSYIEEIIPKKTSVKKTNRKSSKVKKESVTVADKKNN